MAIQIIVTGTPAPKGSPRVITRDRNGKYLKKPRVLKDSKKTEAWHNLVAATARTAMRGRDRFIKVALSVDVDFYFQRPGGHYGKRGLRPSAPRRPKVKPDLDKLVRATMDPLEGIVFDQDSRIVAINAHKRYAELGASARAEITVSMTLAEEEPK